MTGATAGVCVPLEGYLTFEGAATGFASADAAKIKGKTCAAAAGYLLIKAAPADIFGTCTVSTNCLTSTAVSPITIAAFELLCTICKPGFYKVTLAAGDVTTNPCGPIPDAANCLQAKDIVLTAETVAANCELCKAGYFPLKAAGVNAFGTCTLITKKQTCLEYTVGAALD